MKNILFIITIFIFASCKPYKNIVIVKTDTIIKLQELKTIDTFSLLKDTFIYVNKFIEIKSFVKDTIIKFKIKEKPVYDTIKYTEKIYIPIEKKTENKFNVIDKIFIILIIILFIIFFKWLV